jgi:hypothetical protein
VYTRAVRGRAAARGLVLLLVGPLAGCGSDSPVAPAAVDVRVVYVSRLPPGCPDGGSPCYAMCAHHNAPAGLQAIVPLWEETTLRLEETAPGRYEGVLAGVPVGVALRLYGRDIGACCVDACSYPPVLEEIRLNGTTLTHVVHEGLPAGVAAALELTVRGDGTVDG